SSTDADYYQWDFGDNNTSGGFAPSHVFGAAGTYTVRLIAENLNSCRDTAYTQVVGFPLPTAGFTFAPTSSCTSPVAVQFTDAAQEAISYAWTFSNGETSPLNGPLVTFPSDGTWYATQTVTNSYGCSDAHTDSMIVHPTPLAAFTVAPRPGCAGYPILFDNQSVNSSTFEWLFGDGGSSTDSVATHSYEEGLYDVTLIATGAGGCTDTLAVANAALINPTPLAAFDYDTLQSISYALQFTNLSEGSVRWHWDFGDGSSSNQFDPLHLFPAGPNTWYPLCLIATNTFGCPDTVCREVRAPADPNIYAPNAFTPDLDGLNETWTPVLNGFDGWRYHLYILDRWGEVLWDTQERTKSWDGNSRGQVCKTEVYVWKVELNTEGNERVYYGHVTLVRGTE
ncbi:MAG TPA: PKD domain-containing protein, partial [Flavobacteriales bacterium]|nr:PKD domain-containing protein [Flavobacteriales bacterium]